MKVTIIVTWSLSGARRPSPGGAGVRGRVRGCPRGGGGAGELDGPDTEDRRQVVPGAQARCLGPFLGAEHQGLPQSTQRTAGSRRQAPLCSPPGARDRGRVRGRASFVPLPQGCSPTPRSLLGGGSCSHGNRPKPLAAQLGWEALREHTLSTHCPLDPGNSPQ